MAFPSPGPSAAKGGIGCGALRASGCRGRGLGVGGTVGRDYMGEGTIYREVRFGVVWFCG